MADPVMAQDQFTMLYNVLDKIANKSYAITAASDWPALVTVGGLLLLAITAMWADLKSSIKDDRKDRKDEDTALKTEWKADLAAHKQESTKANDDIWAALRACKKDCAETKRQIPRQC